MVRVGNMTKELYIAVVALAFVGVVSAIQRTSLLAQSVPLTDFFNGRFAQHPVLTLLHILPGLIFCILGPLQFATKIRRNYPTFHKWSGRVYVVAGIFIGISALILVYVLGLAGIAETVNVTLFASLFLIFLGLAVYRIRRREVAAHREWMIRAFALGLASASLRLIFLIVTAVSDFSFAESFLIALWISFPLHLVIAELWIIIGRRSRVE